MGWGDEGVQRRGPHPVLDVQWLSPLGQRVCRQVERRHQLAVHVHAQRLARADDHGDVVQRGRIGEDGAARAHRVDLELLTDPLPAPAHVDRRTYVDVENRPLLRDEQSVCAVAAAGRRERRRGGRRVGEGKDRPDHVVISLHARCRPHP